MRAGCGLAHNYEFAERLSNFTEPFRNRLGAAVTAALFEIASCSSVFTSASRASNRPMAPRPPSSFC
jgi:hypothetical protein